MLQALGNAEKCEAKVENCQEKEFEVGGTYANGEEITMMVIEGATGATVMENCGQHGANLLSKCWQGTMMATL